jgi:uracil-DNA glycosylase
VTPSTMPDPAPTVQQLLAFYLEAGVDCALTEEPANRLSDPDIAPGPGVASPSETIPARTVESASEAIRVGAGSGADRADA